MMNDVAPYTILSMPSKVDFKSPLTIEKRIELRNQGYNERLFPDGKKPSMRLDSDFFFTQRVRENKSTNNSSSIDYNRWEFFVENKSNPVSSVKFMDNLLGN